MAWLSSWNSFVKVVEGGSMAAAARRLDVTRAQVSKQIADLEEAFGTRLLERSTRRLTLTAAGEVFHQHAIRTLASIHGTEVAVKNFGDVPRGVLRISATITFGRLVIAPLLPALVAKYPELDCELMLTDALVDLVDDHIDLALRMTKAPPEDAVVRKIVALKRVICAAPNYLQQHGVPHTPHDLARHQCFSNVVSDFSVWELTGRDGKEVHIPAASRVRFNNAECLLDVVRQGHGIAVLPTYLCGADLAAGKLQRVLPDFEAHTRVGSDVYACYSPSRVRAPKVRVFIEALEQHFRPVPPWERH